MDGNEIRRATDLVLNDDSLIASAATSIARALNLEGNNRTLGRKFVRMALDSSDIDNFKEKSSQYGKIKSDLLVEIFHSIKQRHSNLLIQLKNDSECDDQSSDFLTIPGFSSNSERLNSDMSMTSAKGGLASKQNTSTEHKFQIPFGVASKKTQGSLLGLDKLAQQKRASLGLLSIPSNDMNGDQPKFEMISNNVNANLNAKPLARNYRKNEDMDSSSRSNFDFNNETRTQASEESRNKHRNRDSEEDRKRDRDRVNYRSDDSGRRERPEGIHFIIYSNHCNIIYSAVNQKADAALTAESARGEKAYTVKSIRLGTERKVETTIAVEFRHMDVQMAAGTWIDLLAAGIAEETVTVTQVEERAAKSTIIKTPIVKMWKLHQ